MSSITTDALHAAADVAVDETQTTHTTSSSNWNEVGLETCQLLMKSDSTLTLQTWKRHTVQDNEADWKPEILAALTDMRTKWNDDSGHRLVRGRRVWGGSKAFGIFTNGKLGLSVVVEQRYFDPWRLADRDIRYDLQEEMLATLNPVLQALNPTLNHTPTTTTTTGLLTHRHVFIQVEVQRPCIDGETRAQKREFVKLLKQRPRPQRSEADLAGTNPNESEQQIAQRLRITSAWSKPSCFHRDTVDDDFGSSMDDDESGGED